MRIFLAAYRSLSFGAAATQLGLDTSTVSRRVASLEAGLGRRLFERTREGLLPTPAAERMLEAGEAMEAAHARLARDASDSGERAEGTVRLTADPGVAEVFVVPALPRLRARYPRIELELDASPVPRDLARREADLALRSTSLSGANLVATKVSSASWLPAGSPELVRALGSLRAWGDAPWVAWDKDMTTFPPARWVARHAAHAAIPLRTSHFASHLAAAAAGLGLALVPAPFVRARALAQARSAKVLAPTLAELPRTELWLIGHRVLREVPKVNAVWTFLLETLRGIDRER